MRLSLMISLMSMSFVLVSNAETRTNAEQYIGLYDFYLRGVSCVKFTSSESSYTKSEPTDIQRLDYNWKIDFEGKRYWCEEPWVTVPADNGDGVVYRRFSENSFLPKNSITVSVYSRSDSDEVETEVSSFLKVAKEMWSKELRMLELSFPFGYFQDGFNIVYLPDMCRAGKTEILATEPYIELRSKYRDLVITLTLDPQKNYSARKIVVDIIAQQPTSAIFSYRYVYEVEKFIEVKGRWFPEKYIHQDFFTGGKLPNVQPGSGPVMLSNGQVITNPETYVVPSDVLVSECTLSNVDFPESMSDDDFRITTPIPDGSVVHMQDALHIQYVWRDGKIVPLVDDVLDQLRGHKFIPGAREPRFWFLIVGVVLILIAIGGQIWKYISKRKDSGDDINA
jgi:hypothetical protein